MTVAVIVLAPSVGPNVHVVDPMPSDPVRELALVTEPPPDVTAHETVTLPSGVFAKFRTSTLGSGNTSHPGQVVVPSPSLITTDRAVDAGPSTQSTGTGVGLEIVADVPSAPLPQQNGWPVMAAAHEKPMPPPIRLPNGMPPATAAGTARDVPELPSPIMSPNVALPQQYNASVVVRAHVLYAYARISWKVNPPATGVGADFGDVLPSPIWPSPLIVPQQYPVPAAVRPQT
jgi:hypothetical protein